MLVVLGLSLVRSPGDSFGFRPRIISRGDFPMPFRDAGGISLWVLVLLVVMVVLVVSVCFS